MNKAGMAAVRGMVLVVVLLGLAMATPALAAAELAFTSPGGSANSPVTFEGTTNGTENLVTVSITGGALTSPLVKTGIPSGGRWSAGAEALAPGTYTAAAEEATEVPLAPSTTQITFEVVVPNAAPVVTQNPAGFTAKVGGSATFTASASGTPTPTVQWQVSQDGGTTWASDTTDAGNATDTLTVASVTSAQNGNRYRAVFSNGVGEPVPSAAATLKVPPTVTGPTSVSVAAGESATFTVTVTGTAPVSILWGEREKGGNFHAIPGQTTATLVLTKVTRAQNGHEYGVRATDSGGSAESSPPATLTVTSTAPVVTQQPTPVANPIALGSAGEFTTVASGAPPPETVQWEESRDGGRSWRSAKGTAAAVEKSPQASEGKFKTEPQRVEGEFLYRASFANEAGHVLSNPAVLTVTSPSAPSVLVNPISTTVTAGGNATFTAAAIGPPPPTVQWEFSGNGGASWSAVPGGTNDTLTFNGVGKTQTGYQYRALFTNELGTATTSVATLTVTSPPSPPIPVAPLVASFSWFPAAPHTGEPVQLASTSTGGPIGAFAWDLVGNGAFVAGGPILTTTFTTPGAHVVRLRTSAANGSFSVASETIHVTAPERPLLQPFPIVRMAGSLTGSGVRIGLLTAQAPVGSIVKATCLGRRCPLKAETQYAVQHRGVPRTPVVTLWRFERFLPAGVALQIRVYKTGEIGKYTSLAIRRARLPLRSDVCFDPIIYKPIGCPGA